MAMGSWGREWVVFFAVGGFARLEPCVFRFGFLLECFSVLLLLMGALLLECFSMVLLLMGAAAVGVFSVVLLLMEEIIIFNIIVGIFYIILMNCL